MYNKKAAERSIREFTYQEIAEQNGIENPDMIHPGDVIEFGNEKSDAAETGLNQESSKTEGNGNAEKTSLRDDFWGETDSSDDYGNEGNLTETSAKDEQSEKSGKLYENVIVEEEKNGNANKTSKSTSDLKVPDYGLPMTEIEIAIKAHPDNYGNESLKESYKISVFKESSSNWGKEVFTYLDGKFMNSTEKAIGDVGAATYLTILATKDIESLKNITKTTSKFSDGLGYVSTVIDGLQFAANPTIKNARDFAVSVIGTFRFFVTGMLLNR